MKTNSKALASFLAAAVWADGEYCEFEQSLVADMGDLLDAKHTRSFPFLSLSKLC